MRSLVWSMALYDVQTWRLPSGGIKRQETLEIMSVDQDGRNQ